MASPQTQAFFSQSNATANREVSTRIQQGTKAGNPQQLNKRRGIVKYVGEKINPKSAGATVFFGADDSRFKPLFDSLRGGIKDFEYAKMLLDQRKKDFDNLKGLQDDFETVKQIDEAQGRTFDDQEELKLSPFESKLLELNNLLQTIQTAANIEDVPAAELPDMKNVLRLFATVLPGLSNDDVVDYIRVFESILPALRDELSASGIALRDYINKLLEFLNRYVDFTKNPRSFKEKSVFIRTNLRQLYKVAPRVTRDEERIGRAEAERVEEEEFPRRRGSRVAPPVQAPDEAIASLTGELAPLRERDRVVPPTLEDVTEEETESPIPLGITTSRGNTDLQNDIINIIQLAVQNKNRNTLEAYWKTVYQQNRNLSNRTVLSIGQGVVRRVKQLTDEELEELFVVSPFIGSGKHRGGFIPIPLLLKGLTALPSVISGVKSLFGRGTHRTHHSS
jgi:hypothetical protein